MSDLVIVKTKRVNFFETQCISLIFPQVAYTVYLKDLNC